MPTQSPGAPRATAFSSKEKLINGTPTIGKEGISKSGGRDRSSLHSLISNSQRPTCATSDPPLSLEKEMRKQPLGTPPPSSPNFPRTQARRRLPKQTPGLEKPCQRAASQNSWISTPFPAKSPPPTYTPPDAQPPEGATHRLFQQGSHKPPPSAPKKAPAAPAPTFIPPPPAPAPAPDGALQPPPLPYRVCSPSAGARCGPGRLLGKDRRGNSDGPEASKHLWLGSPGKLGMRCSFRQEGRRSLCCTPSCFPSLCLLPKDLACRTQACMSFYLLK